MQIFSSLIANGHVFLGPPTAGTVGQVIARSAVAGSTEWISAGSSFFVDVSSFSTGGDGTLEDPWTGWDTAITWIEHTGYHFRKGYYAFATSPAWMLNGIALIGDAGGVYLQHTGTGNAFIMDAGAATGWKHDIRIENLFVLGNYLAGAGTAVATSGTATIVGTGTAFLTAVSIGDTISFQSETSFVESHVVTDVADDTHLTVDANWVASQTGAYIIGKTTNGFFLRGLRNSIVSHCSASSAGVSAIWTEACVTNILFNFHCTGYSYPANLSGYPAVRSQYGIVTTSRGGYDWSTVWTITNPIIEICQTIGIWFKSDSFGNIILGGTSEGHAGICVGLQINGTEHTIINTDIESNAGSDNIIIYGSRNQLINVRTDDVTTIYGAHNFVLGGHYNYLTVETGAYYNVLLSPKVSITYTDNGNKTDSQGVSTGSFLTKWGIVQPITQAPNISGGEVTTDIGLGTEISIAAFENFLIKNPSITAPVNGQVITYRVLAAVAPRTITYGDKFYAPFGTLPSVVPQNFYLRMSFAYNSTSQRWEMHSLSPDQLGTGVRTGTKLLQDTGAWVVPSSTNISEGVNLYYTDVRADARITLQKAAANGLATLGADSKIPTSQLPALAITDTFVVVSQVAMLALTAEVGDVAVRTDLNKTFILDGADPTNLAHWQELLTPTDTVISVNGFTGAVTLVTTNIAEGTNLYYTDERVDDRVAALVIAGTNVTVAYNDGAGTLTFSVTAFPYGSLTGTPATFAPSAHATSHQAGGADEVTIDYSDLTGVPPNSAAIVFKIGDGVNVIPVNTTEDIIVPFGMTITGWRLIADVSGSIVLDVWKDTMANHPPTVADTIAGSEKPTLSSAIQNSDIVLGTWTPTLTTGDVVRVNVDISATVKRITLVLFGTKT